MRQNISADMETLGAKYLPNNRCAFKVWAPEKDSMILHMVYPAEQEISMTKSGSGHFVAEIENVRSGARYFFKPDGIKDYPDPASNSQPQGVYGPSEVVDHHAYIWSDLSWHGIPLKNMIIYEVHVGTFTQEGTFEAMVPMLDDLAATGINAIEIMPVGQFPGTRNWGYDGVYPYAVQNSYGGPSGLKKFVDACHIRGIAVLLDVVYNHLGPEGNYLGKFAPYFTNRYKVFWGEAINYDGEWSDGVREYFSGNLIHWFENYHIDGVRVDAIHMIFDQGAVHFWELVQEKVKDLRQRLGRQLLLIAESDLNSPRVVRAPELGGYGFDAQWFDDFHHTLYVLLDKNGKKRYEDFGQMEQLAKAFTDGFVHSGEYVKFRRRKYGASSVGISGDKFVVFNQNHDQIGNRVKGERLSVLVNFSRLKIAAAALLLSPYIPLLFMGEEYGEDTPFYYFVSHSDKNLIKAVREGRKKEFEGYKWEEEPPDPLSEDTFIHSKISWQKRKDGQYHIMLEWHKELISFRQTHSALVNFNKNDIKVYFCNEQGLLMHRRSENQQQHVLCLFNFSEENIVFTLPSFTQQWVKCIDSKDRRWLLPDEQRPTATLPQQACNGQSVIISGCSVAVYEHLL